jgi:hypothetical protein
VEAVNINNYKARTRMEEVTEKIPRGDPRKGRVQSGTHGDPASQL